MFEALVYSNVIPVAVACSLLLGHAAILGHPMSWPLALVLSAGTFGLYQIDRGFLSSREDLQNKPARVEWVRKHRRFLWISTIIAALAAAVGASQLRLQTLAGLAAVTIVGASYTIAWPPGRRRLKDIPFAKALVVGLVWSFSTVMLPVVEAGRACDRLACLLFAYRFLWLLPNLILSNWHDREGDRNAGLRTFASEWPEARILQMTHALIALAIVTAAAMVVSGIAPPMLRLDAGGLLLLSLMLGRQMPRAPAFYLLTIDALAAWPLVTFLVSAYRS